MSKEEIAISRFEEGYMCSQSVFSTYAPDLGVDRDTAIKIAGAFGGGVGRTGEICGAVSGALMALGLKHASTLPGEQEKEKIYVLVKEFLHRFKTRNRSVICRELLQCDISTPEGIKRAKEQKLIANTCPLIIRDACEILEQLL